MSESFHNVHSFTTSTSLLIGFASHMVEESSDWRSSLITSQNTRQTGDTTTRKNQEGREKSIADKELPPPADERTFHDNNSMLS